MKKNFLLSVLFYGCLFTNGQGVTADDFKKHMDHWIQRFRVARPANDDQPVLIPGDPERWMEKERRENGIPLLPAVVEDLRKLSDKLGLPFIEE